MDVDQENHGTKSHASVNVTAHQDANFHISMMKTLVDVSVLQPNPLNVHLVKNGVKKL